MDISIANFLFALLLLSTPMFIFIITKKHNKGKKPQSSGVKTYPIFGILLEFIKNRHRFLDWTTEVLANTTTQTMVFHCLGQTSRVITANPLNVEYMLKTNFHNYPKGEDNFSMMEDFFGHGIFNSDGELWKTQRKTASFEFNNKSLRNFVAETVRFEITHRLIPLLESASTKGEVVDLQDVLQRFTFDNICKVAFSVDPASLAKEASDQNVPPNFMEAFDTTAKLNTDRFLEPVDIAWKIKKFLNIGSERQLKESNKIVQDFALKVVRLRKSSNPLLAQNYDILSRFASGDHNKDEFLKDVVVNFIVAGRETTSSVLTWFFWLLSIHPEINAKVVNEIKSVRSKNPNPEAVFSFEELRDMHYLHAAITETLRLYPPVPVDSMSCRDGDVMPDGTHVGKDWFVTYSAFSMGRMKSIWGDDCCKFRPERWLVDGVFKLESPFRFPVFHAGPRMCLGKEMAYLQMKSIAASVLEKFEVEVVKEKPAEYVMSLTLRMKDGLPIRVREIGE